MPVPHCGTPYAPGKLSTRTLYGRPSMTGVRGAVSPVYEARRRGFLKNRRLRAYDTGHFGGRSLPAVNGYNRAGGRFSHEKLHTAAKNTKKAPQTAAQGKKRAKVRTVPEQTGLCRKSVPGNGCFQGRYVTEVQREWDFLLPPLFPVRSTAIRRTLYSSSSMDRMISLMYWTL